MSERISNALIALAKKAESATKAELTDAIQSMGEGCLFDDILGPSEEEGAIRVIDWLTNML